MRNSSATTAERIGTGIPGLDDILHGGLLAHRLYVIEGSPGAGKTTLALQYLIDGAKRGEKCLYITLSETIEELRAGAASHDWSLEGIDLVELVPEESELRGDAMVTMYPPSEVELTETTKRVLQAVTDAAPTRVVFDSASEVRLLAQSSLRYRRQILALKQFFSGRRCTVLLLDDCTSETTDMQLHSIAHGVVSLEQALASYGPVRRRIRISKFRGSDFRGGFHDFVINRAGVVVFPRLIAMEHSEAFEPDHIASGVGNLDALLGGGPDRGTSTLLMGPAGSGKSTIAIRYAVAAAQRGNHAAIFAFDESQAVLEHRMAALGSPLKIGRQKGEVSVTQVDPATLSPGEFTQLVRNAVEQDQARVIVIDSLNGYMNAMPDEKFLAMHLHELLTYLGRRGVTTFMVVAQHGVVGGAIQAPIDASYLADCVVVLRYFEFGGKLKKAISVIKKRSGAHEESIRELRFDDKGIHLGEPMTAYRGILTGEPVEIDGERGNA